MNVWLSIWDKFIHLLLIVPYLCPSVYTSVAFATQSARWAAFAYASTFFVYKLQTICNTDLFLCWFSTCRRAWARGGGSSRRTSRRLQGRLLGRGWGVVVKCGCIWKFNCYLIISEEIQVTDWKHIQFPIKLYQQLHIIGIFFCWLQRFLNKK